MPWPQLQARASAQRARTARPGRRVQRRAREAARASAACEQANARYAEIATTQRQIRQSVLQALVQHQTSFTRISQTEQAAKSSEDVKSSYERQYVAGRRTWLDLMNAVRELSNAELNAVSAKTTALSAASKLRLQTCQWASFQTDQQK